MRQLRTALGFFTPLPVGTTTPDTGTPAWFPAIGVLLGGVLALVWWGAEAAFPALVAGALVVAADLLLTGALHLDGLADTADGVLAHKGVDRARRLAIMKAPDVGAFGVAAVVVVLALRWSVFASIDVDAALVVALWAASRGVMALALLAVPYVGGGLGAAFVGDTRRFPMVLATAVAVPVAAACLSAQPIVTTIAVGCAWLAAFGIVTVVRRRLGGITGDVLGAAGMVVETVGLVVASARW